MVMEKTSKPTEFDEDKKISWFCRLNLKGEALLYTVLAFIIYFPIACLLAIGKGVIWFGEKVWWVVYHIPEALEWFIDTIVFPFCNILFVGLVYILSGIWYILIRLPEYIEWILCNVLVPLVEWCWKAILYILNGLYYCLVIIWKGLVIVYRVVEWGIERVLLPIFTILWIFIRYIGIALILIARVIGNVLKELIRLLVYLYIQINWCAVRSLIRIGTVISIIISCGYIGKGLFDYPVNIIITGYYYDDDPAIQFIHLMIAVLMVSIVLYYHAWVYSSKGELQFVCKNTWQCSSVRTGLRDLWNK